ncbi:MAG: hypothetical protein ACREXX_10725, partial [Gammaproteobacteria bacterium]
MPNDPQHSAYKLLVGRLYNAGLKVRVLEEVFQTDRKTIRLWGQALRSRDPEQLQRVLLGRETARKRTAAIEAYARQRWRPLQAGGWRNYRQKLGQEIREIFGISLSRESLRLLVKDLKQAQAHGAAPGTEGEQAASDTAEPTVPAALAGPATEPPPADAAPAVTGPAAESGMPSATTAANLASAMRAAPRPPPSGGAAEVVAAREMEETTCPTAPLAPGGGEPMGQLSPPSWSPQPGETYGCDHAGLLWFAAALGTFPAAVNPREPLLAQWLASVLLGAMNIEQTKYLHWEDLSLLLHSVVRFPTPQRDQLKRLSTAATVDAVLRWNLAQLDQPPGSDLYLDPHTKHYTGMQAVLKGWCAAIRWADKAVHSDFVHTDRGQPIYFECTDNFEDLRARFAPLIQRMRASLGWSKERVLTMVVDRGIYSSEVFEAVIKEPSLHLITWQKGYEPQPWQPEQASGSFGLERPRNHARDLRLYRFEYIDRRWDKNPALRQLIVRATNPAGRTVQLAILTDELERAAAPIIRLMFSRWLQENDFKYLDKHFGLNQLTSYRSIPYQELKGQLTDRQVQSQACRELSAADKDLQRQQARVLLIEERAQRAETQRQQTMRTLQEQLPPPEADAQRRKTQTRELARLKTASRRYEAYRQQRRAKLDGLHEQRERNQASQAAAQQEVSRVEQLIARDMVRLDTSSKRLMDAVKITARNLFYQAIAPFKKAYNNYRDDHDYFRQLTLTAGVLRWTGQEIEVHLVPHLNYPPQLRTLIRELMRSLNERGLTLPDGSQRKLRFFLTLKEQI